MGDQAETVTAHPATPDAALVRAKELQAAGRPEDALHLLEAATVLHPRDHRPWLACAKILGGIDARRALAVWQEASDRFPSQPPIQLGLAEMLEKLGRVDDALALADHICRALRFGDGTMLALCRLYMKCGDHHTAMLMLEPRIAQLPPSAGVYHVLAQCYARLGKRELAHEMAAEGVRRCPDHRQLSAFLTSAAVSMGDFKGAVARIDQDIAKGEADQSLRGRLAEAAVNLEFMQSLPQHIEVVSLGQQCLGWSVPNRWGMRNFFWLQNRRSPFNQAFNTGDATAQAIETDFSDFLDPASLRFRKGPSGRPVVSNPKSRVTFNHEDGRGWVADNGSRLHADYAERIGNFRRLVAEHPCLFLYSLHATADIGRLERALARIALHGRFRILVLDHRDPADPLATSERIDYLHAPFPENYIWHRHYTTATGVGFERAVIEAMKQSLLRF